MNVVRPARPIHLARPLALPCGAALPNRIAKAAMSEVLADRDTGAPTDALVELYARWGRSGAGLLLTGNVMVGREARGELGQVVVEDDRHLPILRRWAEAAQAAGARLWMQINHAGRQAPRTITTRPAAPSEIAMKGLRSVFAPPRALSDDDVRAIIRRFAIAARVAKAAGFAGVQIHAAHGYLLSQFLSPLANRRDDTWGGDATRRMRMLLEIVRAVRAEVGAAFPVGVKLNSADFQRGGFDEDESMRVVVSLAAEGVDLLEISGGNYESPAMMGGAPNAPKKRASTVAREAFFLDYARKVRAVAKIPLLLTGGMRTSTTMESVVARGEVDAVGMARPMAFEPDLPARILAGEASAAQEVELGVGIRLADDLLHTLFSQAQLARMSHGLAPDPGMSRWRVLLAGIWNGYVANPFACPAAPSPSRARPIA
ncbi:MAG: NADH:flavin oxidoreductase/NADH oxidase family protein [Labilithrix sp.]|nr:NADH:flavin oxidoreductase/NADH oxidase family protein [Labilithrix sp.]